MLANCIKCARCAQVCPYGSIRLAPISTGVRYGTPEIDPLVKPCYLCMKCPGVCPTAALNPVEKSQVRMGKGRIEESTCLSYDFTVCNLCYKQCPLKGTAIELDKQLRPIIHEKVCVGCGVCFHVCPSEPGSIHLTVARAT